MQHLNPYLFYELAAKLNGLFNITTQTRVSDMFAPLSEAQALLDGWIKGEEFPLTTSRDEARRLFSRLSNIFEKYYIDPTSKQLRTPSGEDRIDAHELAMLYSLVEKFEHALAADFSQAPVYAAQKRGIYSTYDLIENAQLCFSESIRKILPASSMEQFNAAGRALAFGMGTATCLHLLRAVEIVLREYYEVFAEAPLAKTERTYSIYLKKLAALTDDDKLSVRPDKRLLQMLAQIKEHYRNPLALPEKEISIDQATSLFSLATAVITLMSEQIEAKKSGKGSEEKAHEALSDVADAAQDDEDEESYDFSSKKKAG